MQFSAIPLNLLGDRKTANYLTMGTWSQAAIKEAKKFCEPNEVWPTSEGKFNTIPDPETWKIDPNAAYFHYCDNETIHGVEFKEFPFDIIPKDMTIVADVSSNFMTKQIDWSKHGVVYAGA